MKKLLIFYALCLISFVSLAQTITAVDNTYMTDDTQSIVFQIADDYEKKYFEHFPEMALFWGKAGIEQSRFSDHSIEARQAWEQLEDTWIEALNKVDERSLIGTNAHTTYLLLKENLDNEKAVRMCQEPLWNVNPLNGWHIILGNVAEKQPLENTTHLMQALKRWSSVPKLAEDEIANLKTGLTKGYTAPKPAVKRVINQLEMMLDTPIEKSPFYVMIDKASDQAFRKEMTQIIQTKVNPSLEKYLVYLQKEYLPHSRDEIGLSALPNGMECYQTKLKQFTTLSIDPETIFNYGEEHMAELSKEIATIGLKEFGLLEPNLVFQQAIETSKNTFHSENELIAYNQNALAKAQAQLPQWFYEIPKAQCQLKPYPLHRAKSGAPGEYHPPHEDGKTPGTFYINTYEPMNKSRVDLEATLFHELLPGHHYQIALAQEDKKQHSVNQYLWNSGFVEGWALYTERLADEMELYEDNISKLGMLSNEALRTARLVVDPGIHAFGWTRDEAITFLEQFTAMDKNIIAAEVDRYIMLPGQATSYMLGKREIEKLRTYAATTLKDKFDIREFHKQVLKNGAVTLPMLQANLMSWVETEQLNSDRA